MSDEQLPESAFLDHRMVKAPYLRYAGVININDKDKVYKFDLRFIQPNSGLMPTDALHSLEHLLAVATRKYIDNIVDISPMGCLTGFYIVTINKAYDELISALEKAFKDILDFDEVPFANEIQCGAAKNHNLTAAKKYAQMMLDARDNWETGAKDAMNKTNQVELH